MELRKSSPSRVRCGDTGAHHHRVPIAVGCPQEPPPSCRTTPQTAPARPEGSPHLRARCPGTSPAPRRGGSRPGGRRGGPAGRGCRGCPRWRPWLQRGRVRPPAPSPCLPPPPPKGSTGHPGSQGGQGGSEEHGDLCGTTRCTCTVRVKLPNPAFFSPKRSAQIPKGSPQPPQPHHAPGQRSRMRPQSSALLSSPVRPHPAPGRSG